MNSPSRLPTGNRSRNDDIYRLPLEGKLSAELTDEVRENIINNYFRVTSSGSFGPTFPSGGRLYSRENANFVTDVKTSPALTTQDGKEGSFGEFG